MITSTRHGFFSESQVESLLLSSIALVVVTGVLVTINYIELRNQFEQRARNHKIGMLIRFRDCWSSRINNYGNGVR